MKKGVKALAVSLCIAATFMSATVPAMAVSPAEYTSTAVLEQCNTATVAAVENLISQIGTVTTARRPAIVAAVNAYNELDDASKAQVSNFAVLAEAQQVLGLKDALAKLKISYDKVEDARSYVSPTEDRLSNQGKSYILPFFVNGSTNDPSIFALECHGDSMAPTICDGDVVCIRSQPEVEQGQIAAVRIGEEATLKHCYYQNGVVQLIADNPSVCPPLVYTGPDLEDIEIEGLAVGFCRGLV